MKQSDRESQLIELLVANYPNSYQVNSVFYHSVNNLVAMLPAMVAGIAGWAKEEQQRIDAEIAEIADLDISLMPDEAAALSKALDRIEGNDEWA